MLYIHNHKTNVLGAGAEITLEQAKALVVDRDGCGSALFVVKQLARSHLPHVAPKH